MKQILMCNRNRTSVATRLAQGNQNIQHVVGTIRIVPDVQLFQALAFGDETNDRIARVVMIACEDQMQKRIRIVLDQVVDRTIR